MIETEYYLKSKDLRAREIDFSYFVLRHTPGQLSENLSSEIHETNRISDPYIFLVNKSKGKLQTPDGQDIDGFMDKSTDRGRLENVAFEQIQSWSMNTDKGYAVWFSPPYEDKKTVSKIIVSKIMELDPNHSMLLNRAILLDIDAQNLLGIANQLISGTSWMPDPEVLRSLPLFPSEQEFDKWFRRILPLSNQFEQVVDGSDLSQKLITYQKVKKINDGDIYQDYDRMYKEAQRANLVGGFAGSCPPSLLGAGATKNTPFSVFSQESKNFSETKTLECTCPFCEKKVTAIIAGGKIRCPNCKESVPYSC